MGCKTVTSEQWRAKAQGSLLTKLLLCTAQRLLPRSRRSLELSSLIGQSPRRRPAQILRAPMARAQGPHPARGCAAGQILYGPPGRVH